MAQWLARLPKVLVNFVDPGSIPAADMGVFLLFSARKMQKLTIWPGATSEPLNRLACKFTAKQPNHSDRDSLNGRPPALVLGPQGARKKEKMQLWNSRGFDPLGLIFTPQAAHIDRPRGPKNQVLRIAGSSKRTRSKGRKPPKKFEKLLKSISGAWLNGRAIGCSPLTRVRNPPATVFFLGVDTLSLCNLLVAFMLEKIPGPPGLCRVTPARGPQCGVQRGRGGFC